MTVTISDTLHRTRDIIENRGWTQSYLARDQNYKPVDYSDKKAACWCIAGALRRAADELSHNQITVSNDLYYTGIRKLRENLPSQFLSVPDFNDNSNTTKEDVLTLIDDTLESLQ